jgi:hypothetical protein
MEEALGPVAVAVERPLRTSKNGLANVHTCEAYYRAEKDAFAWAARTAVGTVAHRALRLSIALGGDPAPLDLVDMAIDAFTAEDGVDGLGAWLRAAPAQDLAELRADANERVVLFQECFPPLRREWRPRTDTPIVVSLCGDLVTLRGRPDLAFGQARGRQAGVVIVDLKTGGRYGSHFDDLRFYALLQTLKTGVPPYRVATYYLDSATFHAEDVTPAILEIAARRTVDGVRKMARLLDPAAAAAISPGPTCRWCRLRHECEGPARLVDGGDDYS